MDRLVRDADIRRCYDQHYDAIYRLGRRFGGEAWAEDLAHDVFVKLAEKIDQLAEVDDLGGWLYRVAHNLAISRLRRQRSFLGRVQGMVSAAATPQVQPDIEVNDLGSKAMAALRELPAKEQAVLSMKVIDGHSQREIAEALSLSEGYVSKLTGRALKRLANKGWAVDE